MGKFKVVVLDNIIPLSNIEVEELAKVGADVIQIPCQTVDDIKAAAGDADGVIQVNIKLTKEAISVLDNCKVISHYGIGLDTIDLNAATEKNIVVTHVPVYCQEEVATLAMTLLLACERRILPADKIVKEGKWINSLKAAQGARSLSGKTLGLVGFGSIARSLATIAKPFGLKIVTYDPYINVELAQKMGVEVLHNLEDLLKISDYVSLHAPLTKETEHMIGTKELALMKKEAVLINTARGGLVDQKALTKALQEKQIAWAGLDVLEQEPPDPEDPIFKLDNVITSGHIAAATAEAMERLRLKVAQGVSAVLSGYWPDVVANPAVKQKVTLKNRGDEK